MAPLEGYLEHADELAQDVINTWGPIAQAGGADTFTPQFKCLVDITVLFREARKQADNFRKDNVLTEEIAGTEQATRQAFAEAYKAYYEKRVGAA
jgi:hypothetical protein